MINGGAFVLPFIHDYHAGQHERAADGGRARQAGRADHPRPHARRHRGRVLCPRRRRPPKRSSIAAATLGRRTMEPEQLHELLVRQVRLGAALRRRRDDDGGDARAARRLCRARQGARGRGAGPERPRARVGRASPSSTRPTWSIFNPSNRFDAEGLTRLTEDIEAAQTAQRHRAGHDDRDPHPEPRGREAGARDRARERDARLDQQREVEMRRALQRAEVARERALRETEAEQAQIAAREDDREGAHRQRAGDQPRRASPRSARPGSARSSARARSRRRRSRRARRSRRRGSPTSARSNRPHRLRARGAPARDRAHADRRGSRDRGARSDREGAHPAGRVVTEARIANEEETRRPRDRAHPRGRRSRDRGARGDRKGRASRRP